MDFYLQRLQDAITAIIRDLDPPTMLAHPEGKWCPAEILEHLYLTYTGTIKGFERCLEAGKPLARGVHWNDRMRTFVALRLNHMPNGRKAPKHTTPRGLPAEEVRAQIASKIAAMDAIIARAEERYGKKLCLLDHPILGPLRGEQWRKFHWVHGSHHVKQIQALRQLANMK
jgi:hypothetical protein